MSVKYRLSGGKTSPYQQPSEMRRKNLRNSRETLRMFWNFRKSGGGHGAEIAIFSLSPIEPWQLQLYHLRSHEKPKKSKLVENSNKPHGNNQLVVGVALVVFMAHNLPYEWIKDFWK